MGFFTVTPLQAMRVIRKAVFMLGTIPPGRNAPARDFLVNNILWFTCTINAGLCVLSMIGTIIVRRNEMLVVLRNLLELIILSVIEARLFIWKIQWRSLQNVFEEWETFMLNVTPEEEAVLRKYSKKVGPFHTLLLLMCPVTLAVYIAMPAFEAKNLPSSFEVPFEIQTGTLLYCVIYVLESHAAMTAAAAATMDLALMLLLWSTSARFEMLQASFRKVKFIEDVRECLEKQRRLETSLGWQKEILNWMGFTITIVVLIGVTCGGFMLINRTVQEEGAFFFLAMSINVMQLFTYCWAGDNLIETSQGLISACFEADWIDASPEVKSCLRIMIEGCRRPMVISVDGLLPAMSLEYFASSMAAVVSYITSLRAFVQ